MTLASFPLEAFQEQRQCGGAKALKQLFFFPSGMETTVETGAASLHHCSLIPIRQIIIDEWTIPPCSANFNESY